MRLGYACINLTLGRRIRSLRLATFRIRGLPYLQELLDENLALLNDVLRWNRAHGIWMFRLSSDLAPLGSHEEVDLERLDFSTAREAPALARDMRLSMHPGQYTIVSATGRVWDNSRKDLFYHAYVLDRLGLDGDIVLHGGGVYGDRAGTAARIAANIGSLPAELRRRLRLENDERAWSVADLLPICEQTGTPLIVDNLHHALNGGAPLAALPWERIAATWDGRVPKLHYSEQDPAKQSGAHSAYLDVARFHRFMAAVPLPDYDVMLECKSKEQALLRLRADLAGASNVGAAMPTSPST